MRSGWVFLMPALGGCLEAPPFDPGACRTGVYQGSDGFLRDEPGALRLPDGLTDELRRCARASEVVIEGDLVGEDLSPLENIAVVSRLEVIATRGLASIGGLAGLETIEGDLLIRDNADLLTLGLERLRRVDGGLAVAGNPRLSECEVWDLLARLETSPSSVVVGYNAVCPSRGEIAQGFVVEAGNRGTSNDEVELLALDVARASERLLFVRSGPEVDVRGLSGSLTRTATPGAARGTILMTDPAGALAWSAFAGGDWPGFEAEPAPRLRVTGDGAGGAVYVGWVSVAAQIGPHRVNGLADGRGFYFGTIAPDGTVSAPQPLTDRFERGEMPKYPVLLALRPGGGFALLFRSGDVFGLVPADPDGRVRASLFEPAPALSGPVEPTALTYVSPDRLIVTGLRVGEGPIFVGPENLDTPGPFGFAAAFDPQLSAEVLREAFGSEGSPEPSLCVAVDAEAARFLGRRVPEQLELRIRPFGGTPDRTLSLVAPGIAADRMAAPHCRADLGAVSFAGSAAPNEGWTWRLGQLSTNGGPSLRVHDTGRFSGAPAEVQVHALPGGGATLATDLRTDADLGPLGSIEGRRDAGVLILTRTPIP